MANNITLTKITRDSGAYVAGTTFETEQQAGGEHRPVVKVGASDLPAGAATEQGLDDLLTELRLKADLTETQPISAASLPLPTGAATAAAQTDGTQKTQVVTDYYLEASAGNITGSSTLNKFGKNPDVDTAAEDVWGAGGTWTPPTTARLHNIASTDAADTLTTGTGAWTVSILGLNGSYAEVSETVNLSGLTPVATSNAYVIIFRMIVTAAGTGGYNVGNITATAQTDATLTAQIDAGYNQTLMAIWQVPAGKTLYLNSYYASMNGTTAATSIDIRLWAKPFGQVWQTKHVLGLSSVGQSYFRHVFDPPLKYTEKTLIRLQAADASANNIDVSGGFDGIYR